VAFTKDGERLVGRCQAAGGDESQEHGLLHQALHGRRLNEITGGEEAGPVRCAHGKNDLAVVTSRASTTRPRNLRMILQKMRQTAEALPRPQGREGRGHGPRYFNDAAAAGHEGRGQIAGLDVLRIINEPTAAALAYGLDKKKEEKIAVFRLGGGTYDISVLELAEGVFEVKSTNGDTHLGGDDFDDRVIHWLVDEFKKDQGIDLLQGSDGAPAAQGSRREGQDGAVHHHGRPRSTCRSSRRTSRAPSI